jgi:glycosyltransferase involved in cell wall biosynthesis
MRILFISHYFPPENNAPAVRTYEHCRRWVRMGHEVTVITGPPNHPNGVLHPGYRNLSLYREQMDGIDVIRAWVYLAANRGFGRRILNYVSFMFTAIFASLFAPRCDVVIGTSPQFFVAVAACVIAALRRRPFVFEVRDLWPEAIIAVGAMRRGPFTGILTGMSRFLYWRAARVVVVTEAFRRVLEANGVPPEKIAVVTNGVDLEQFRPAERHNAIRRRLGLNGQFVASYVGTLGMAHGLETVLDAAEKLRGQENIKFLIMGDGAERDHLELEHRRRELPNLLLLDAHPHDQVAEVLAASDACMVLLRRTELFKTVLPSKIFEAMGAARPIILGVAGEAERVICAGRCGLVIEPENAFELSEAVRCLAADQARCSWLGWNGRALAEREYDRDHLADLYAGLLEDLLPPVGAPRISRRVFQEVGVRGGEYRNPELDAGASGPPASAASWDEMPGVTAASIQVHRD